MSDPDYKRPFEANDFRGYFTWDSKLSRILDVSLYHACHLNELKQIVEEDQLSLRSKWALIHPEYDLIEMPGVWCGLNYFNAGNHYGPFLIELPISALNGRTFMVFRRTGERKRYFFVQYEARIPIFKFNDKIWRDVNPKSYFKKDGKKYGHKVGAIYDLVLTNPLSILNASIEAVNHPKCIPGKCNGASRRKNKKMIEKLAIEEVVDNLCGNKNFMRLMTKYPGLEDQWLDLSQLQVDNYRRF